MMQEQPFTSQHWQQLGTANLCTVGQSHERLIPYITDARDALHSLSETMM